MQCPQCQFENVATAKFCVECGTKMENTCPSCGVEVDVGDKFCHSCGHALAGAPPAPPAPAAPEPSSATETGTRRPVTVLFADISGFTTLSGKLDPEDTHALLNEFFGVADALVRRFGGSIDKRIGDSVMAVFGAPIAHDNDPERAVRAALDVHEAVADLGNETTGVIRIHAGIAAGEVVASHVGSDDHEEFTVTGETVNLAARLQDLAHPGETLISESVHRQVADLVTSETLDQVSIRGIEDTRQVWRVTGIAAPGATTAEGRLFGRQAELSQLAGALDTCLDSGGGQAICLRGEAGIGKSRLMAEFRDMAEGKGFTCHTTRVLDFGAGLGQDAIRTLVGEMLGTRGDDAEPARAVAAENAVRLGLVSANNVVHLNDLLDVEQPIALRSVYDAMDDDARTSGRRETVSEIAKGLAGRGALALFVEDVQWADSPALMYLAGLCSTLVDYPVLLVMTTRIEGDPLDQNWRAQAHGCPVLTIDLGPLRGVDAVQMAEEFPQLDSAAIEVCVKRADGNPLFLEQLLRSATEHESDQIPESLHSLVLARMDALDSSDREALQGASVLGQRFPLDALRSVLGWDGYECDGLINRLMVRPDNGAYLFSHALIRDGVYASLLNSSKRTLHARAAQYFEDRDPVLHAEHLERADDPRAAAAWLSAAKNLAKRYRDARAAEAVMQGLSVANSELDRFTLTCFSGDLQRRLGNPSDSETLFQQALELAATDSQRCQVLIGIAAADRLLARDDDGVQALDRAQPIAESENLQSEMAQIHYYRGASAFALADFEGCLFHHSATLNIAEQLDAPELQARALSGLGDAYYACGDMSRARDLFQRCLAISQEHGFGRIEVANRFIVGNCRRYMNELREGYDDAVASADNARAIGNHRAEAYSQLMAAEIGTELGYFDDAEQRALRSLEVIESLGNERFSAYLLHHVARAKYWNGKSTEVDALLDEALARARRTRLSFIGPRILGFMAWTRSTPAERKAARNEGEQLIEAGCVAHNALWFYRDAIEGALLDEDWGEAGRFAKTLEDYTARHPLPWAEFFIARGRALAAWGQGSRDPEARARLEGPLELGREVGFAVSTPAIEQALAAKS